MKFGMLITNRVYLEKVCFDKPYYQKGLSIGINTKMAAPMLYTGSGGFKEDRTKNGHMT